ncbi:MAG: glycoside hydrolase family 127 protein [Planctomycetota bacterium]|nr:glycoside hydrolase family 127 protein [Planctomycetota bacterium]
MPGRSCCSLFVIWIAIVAAPRTGVGQQKEGDYPITPVPPTSVQVDHGLWKERIETNRKVTIPYDFQMCEETGRIANFAIAAGQIDGKHQGFWFNDSDVFKVIEGAAASLALHPDPVLEKYLDELIAKIAAAQHEDGYLYTIRTIHGEDPVRLQRYTGKTRWSYLEHSHELYNMGHLYEAAVAYYEATGKRTLLDVALKNADLIDQVFGEKEGQKIDVPGHQEIEIGLVKLYRTTGEKRYLDLAQFFLDHRGVPDGRKENRIYGEYWQDHQPVTEQTEAVGHAVRAAYMYSGMADVAALTGQKDYIDAIDSLWQNVVGKKMYLTGGIGARHHDEAFGENYELPNGSAYNETCAAIANAMWNERMFLLHGESKYIDVLERVLYNGFLAGISMEGNTFFYPNPLSSNAEYRFNKGAVGRQGWFDCSCCPVNIVRFLPAIAGMVYAHKEDNLYVNLFIPGKATISLPDGNVEIAQRTLYPRDALVDLTVTPDAPLTFTLRIRIPGWARGECVPGGLYRYLDSEQSQNDPMQDIRLRINDEDVPLKLEAGYATLRRTWKKGDYVQLKIPTPIRRVVADEKVVADRGRVAVERGPLVYCLEEADNKQPVDRLMLPDGVELKTTLESDLLGGLVVIEAEGAVATEEDGAWKQQKATLRLIPYYAWNHRGNGKMEVWIPRRIETIEAANKPKEKEAS